AVVSSLWFSSPALAGWKYRSTYDQMREAKTVFAETRSNNRAHFSFPYEGGSFLEITLEKTSANRTEAYLWLNKGQLSCLQRCYFTMKFDNGEPLMWSGEDYIDDTNSMIFIENDVEFISALKTSKK